MNDISPFEKDPGKMGSLKTLTAVVYLCQVLMFALVPLLIGVAINFLKRKEVEGTWLESHFDWQINTVWIALAGFALAGITFNVGLGYFILIAVLILTVYRIVIGWMALTADKPVKEG
jgi:uncharacterized membrane protein